MCVLAAGSPRRAGLASTLIANGESLPYIAAQLGHHSPAFTLAVYGHLMPSATGRGVDRLDDLAGRSVIESVTVSAKSAGRLLGRPSSVDDLPADQAASIPESSQTDQLLLPFDQPDP